jgi:hypothetical protein
MPGSVPAALPGATEEAIALIMIDSATSASDALNNLPNTHYFTGSASVSAVAIRIYTGIPIVTL